MAEKRRDKKGRILRKGESQRTDGRYMYRYMDYSGEYQTVYSQRLVETDLHPKGKRQADGVGNGSIILLHKVLNAMFNYAESEDMVRRNYAKGCTRELGIYNNKREH